MHLVDQILLESNILDKEIKNPKTGRNIKVSSALTYANSEPVKKKALALMKKANASVQDDPKEKKVEVAKEPKSLPAPKEKNAKSHKPKSQSYGVSKECVAFLTSKGYKGLNAYPQAFVKPDQIIFNPEVESKGKDYTWVAKFPVKLPNGTEGFKTAYTRGFMKKSQVKKYKKISKIKEKDIVNLEEKTNKFLQNKNKVISDSACIIGIILKTGLRIGSMDSDDVASTGNLGVRTLKKDNIKVNGNKIELNFIGKSYQDNVAVFEDKNIAQYLDKNLKSIGDKENVFSPSYSQVNAFMSKINPKGINPKDLRTYKATEFAKKLLQSSALGEPPPVPGTEKEIKNAVKEKLKKVFEGVSTLLNNSPAMAKNSYVHPAVITDFLTNLGLTPKAVGYKHITMEATKPKSSVKFTSMDQMFERCDKEYNEITDDNVSEEDMYECEEYALPDWWDNDEIVLVKI